MVGNRPTFELISIISASRDIELLKLPVLLLAVLDFQLLASGHGVGVILVEALDPRNGELTV